MAILYIYKKKDTCQNILILSLIKTMQYTNAPYVITEEEDNRIRNRRETFIRETGTEKTVLITMITSFGLAPGGYSDDIQCQLTMADLFR